MNLPTALTAAVAVLCFSACSPRKDASPQQQQPTELQQADYSIGSLHFFDLRATGGIHNGSAAAYVTIANTGSVPDTLVGASSPVCRTTEVHEMIDVDGVKTMRSADHLPIPPSGSVSLKPGGTHIMLMNLKKSLRKKDSVDVVLHFARSGNVPLRMLVR